VTNNLVELLEINDIVVISFIHLFAQFLLFVT